MDSLQYFSGNELAASVWNSKYAMKGPDGSQVETSPDQMHARLAQKFAQAEGLFPNALTYDQIHNRLSNFAEIIPQGSVMAILGNPNQIGSLSNCIVLPELKDSYGGIMYADQQLVQLMKRRCGVGLEISPLRPKGMRVSNAALSSTGGVSYMPRFSNTTREVAQDGRRGALMISCDVRYPDIKDFAVIKNDLTKITGANISIRMRDDFMQAVEKGEKYQLRWPVDASVEEAKFVAECDARDLWFTIVKSAHGFAEPGLIFWDRQHWYSPSSVYVEFRNISTNPCSEIAMGNDSCRLIAANLTGAVRNPFALNAYFDYQYWYDMCYDGMRLMDDLVELELQSIERILEKIDADEEPEHIKAVERETWQQLFRSGARGRRTGFGLTALGDALAMLNLKYDSKEALAVTEKIMRIKLEAELDSMMDMAETRGAFPAWDRQLEAEMAKDSRTFFYMIKEEFPSKWSRMQKVGRRNISWSTLAPTGSLSLLARLAQTPRKTYYSTTSGMEPVFNNEKNTLWHIRRKKIHSSDSKAQVDFVDELGDRWQHFKVFHEGFNLWAEVHYPELNLQGLSAEQLKDLVAESPYGGAGASEIDWIQRVEMQAVLQKYTSHSISSTINLPKDVSVDEVSKIYFESWKRGLKGITVYRDGSRNGVLVSETKEKEKDAGFTYKNAPKRPAELPAEIHSVTAKGVKWVVIVGLYDSKPYEVFAIPRVDTSFDKVKTGWVIKNGRGHYTFVNAEKHVVVDNFTAGVTDEDEAQTRLISTALRHGAAIDFIVEQLNKSHGTVVSFSKAVSRVLVKYAKKLAEKKYTCQNCGSDNVRFEEGCSKCVDCGSSKCS